MSEGLNTNRDPLITLSLRIPVVALSCRATSCCRHRPTPFFLMVLPCSLLCFISQQDELHSNCTLPEASFTWRVYWWFLIGFCIPPFVLCPASLYSTVWFQASYLGVSLSSKVWLSISLLTKVTVVFVPFQKFCLLAIRRNWPAESTAIFKAFGQSLSKPISLWPC